MRSIRSPTQALATTPTFTGYAHTFGRPCASTRSWPAPSSPTSASLDGEAFEQRAQGFELKRGGLPEEIVGAAFYLASDLSSYTTGPILTVDGGQPKSALGLRCVGNVVGHTVNVPDRTSGIRGPQSRLSATRRAVRCAR